MGHRTRSESLSTRLPAPWPAPAPLPPSPAGLTQDQAGGVEGGQEVGQQGPPQPQDGPARQLVAC